MSTTIKEEKDLVWLPKSLADKIKQIEDGRLLEAEIMRYAEQSKENLRIETESIEGDVLQYRAYMVKAKNAFKEAKEEQLTAAYALWEKFEDDMKGLREYVTKAKGAIEPLKNELLQVKQLMGEVDKWGIRELLSIVKELNSNYYSESNNMLRFLLNNYKKPNSEPKEAEGGNGASQLQPNQSTTPD